MISAFQSPVPARTANSSASHLQERVIPPGEDLQLAVGESSKKISKLYGLEI